MGDYHTAGEIVDVGVRRARVLHTTEGWLCVQLGDTQAVVNVPVDDSAVVVQHVIPAEGPVRPDDVWRDRSGCLWLVHKQRSHAGGSSEVVMSSGVSGGQLPSDVCRRYGPLTLVHREPDPSREVAHAG